MTWFLRIVGTITLLLAIILGVQVYNFNDQNFIADKSVADYQSRITPLWPAGKIPGYMDDAYSPDKLPWYIGSWKRDDFELKPYLLRYTLADGPARPAILLFPGGGYLFRSEKHEGIKIANWLNAQGIAAIVVNYRLTPYRHPVPLQDAQQAMRVVHAHAKDWNIDPGKIGVMGFSAGGHLAAMLSTHGSGVTRPDFSVLGYGTLAPATYPIMGLSDRVDSNVEEISPDLHITANTPPTFIWHTKADPLVPYSHSVKYYETLQAASVKSELHLFDKGTHGLGLAEDSEEAYVWPSLLLDWLSAIGITAP